jgi:2-polyprenyl-3-methyl-5-hydroxy-6-metoxy-1,4-benzoquinol methylase
MDRSMRFWNRAAERYSRRPVSDEAAYQKKLQVTRDYLRPDMEVLEFGCGTGSTAIAHAPHVKHIQAIDWSSKMIEIAQRKAESEGVENVTFAQETIDELSVDDRTYDAVLGLSILHLLENWDDVIAKVHGMLVPGGVFVSSTMCLGKTMKFIELIAPVGRFLGLMPMLKVFTTEELEASLTDAGFDIDYRWQPGKRKAIFIVAKRKQP